MMKALQRAFTLAAVLAALASVSPAYYHFLHYDTSTAPFKPIPERFDVNALPNRTLHYYISDLGPTQLAPGDSFAAVLSQIRLAATAWNDVETSDLRVVFGGLFSPGTPQSTPRVEVIFDDVPGLLAMGGPTSRSEMISGPDGPYVPIARSVLVLNRDLSNRASHTEAFFMTVVHELGHALGLQHSFSSGTMSTEVTRATTKGAPLGRDDVAGISSLYPTARFASRTGSISGRVTMDGEGVHLASVVALVSGRTAVSAFTHPDGTYRIDGLGPGQYQVYVHALPPSVQPELGPAEIVLPLGPDQQPIQASATFDTLFYPATKNFADAGVIQVYSGNATEAVDFNVTRNAGLQLHGVTTYSFPAQVPVKPAYFNFDRPSRWFLVATAFSSGLTSGGAPLPGLNVGVLGGSAAVQDVRAYAPATDFLEADFLLTPFSHGPRHVVFNWNNDVYVLPSAFTITQQQPPSISEVTPGQNDSGTPIVRISGTNLSRQTRIYFDGLPAMQVDASEDGDDDGDENEGEVSGDGDDRITVIPPVGLPNHRAAITAINPDGQSSLFVMQSPPVHVYGEADVPTFNLASSSAPAGSERLLEITGTNTHFSPDQTRVGFGSSDIVVKRIAVISPTLLQVQIAVSPSAPETTSLVSVVTGFEAVARPSAFQIVPANPGALSVNSDLINPETSRPAYPGSPAALSVTGLNLSASPILTINGVQVQSVSVAEGQITFQVPPSVQPGLAVLTIQHSGEVYSALVLVDFPPPMVVAVTFGGAPLDPGHVSMPGDLLTIHFSSIPDPRKLLAKEAIRIRIGEVEHEASFAVQPGNQPNLYALQILISDEDLPGQNVPATLTVDGRTSAPFNLNIGRI